MDNYEYCAAWAAHRGKVLDFGCGAGRTVRMLRSQGSDAWGCDIALRLSTPDDVRPFLMLIENGRIPCPDESFDVVTSNYVFEHVKNIESAMTEIARVLKPSGQLLALYPDRSTLIEGHCRIPFAHRVHTGTARVAYVACCRSLGIGGKLRGRSLLQYGRDVDAYIERATCYRSPREFGAVFATYFSKVEHIEREWLTARKKSSRAFKVLAAFPRYMQPALVRRLAGRMVVATKAG